MPRIPGSLLRRASKELPAARLLLLGELALQAGKHLARLEPAERRRLAVLVALGARRRGHLSVAERTELMRLVAKTDPRAFVGLAVRRLSPVPIPRRIIEGKRSRQGR